METKEAIDQLTKALREDPAYWTTWQANIAMAFKDQWQWAVNDGGLPCTPEQISTIANDAATYFLTNLTTRV